MKDKLTILAVSILSVTLIFLAYFGVKSLINHNQNIQLGVDKLTAQELKAKVDKLKSDLKDKVKENKLTESEFNELINTANLVAAERGGLQLTGNITLESILNSL